MILPSSDALVGKTRSEYTKKHIRHWTDVLFSYARSFTSMGVSMGLPNLVTNRWHFTRNA